MEELATPETQQFIDDLIDTMRHANGAGLAANQVGSPVRIAAIEVGDNPRYPYKPRIPLTVVVNPIIEPIDDELVEINEGCLSVPNLRGSVMRHVNVRVRYLDRDGGATRRDQARVDRRHVPARVRSPRRRAVPRSGRRPAHLHDVGAVRAVPPRRVRRADHRVRGQSRLVTTYWCELAWLGDPAGKVEHDVGITVERDRITAVSVGGQPAAGRPSPCRADACRAWRTPTATPFIVPCAVAPTASPARSGRGATGCTRSPIASIPTRTASWPRRRSPRWCWPASPASASSTTSTTTAVERRTRSRTRWATCCSTRRRRPAFASRCSTRATCVPGSPPTPSSTRHSCGSATATLRRGRQRVDGLQRR